MLICNAPTNSGKTKFVLCFHVIKCATEEDINMEQMFLNLNNALVIQVNLFGPMFSSYTPKNNRKL